MRAILDKIQKVILSPRVALGLLGLMTVLLASQFLLRAPRAFIKPTEITRQTELVENQINRLKKNGVDTPDESILERVVRLEEEILPELKALIKALHHHQDDFKTVNQHKEKLNELMGGESYIVDAIAYSAENVTDFSGEVDFVENQNVEAYVGDFDGAYDFLPFYIQTDYLVKDRTSEREYIQRRSWLFSYWPEEDIFQLVGQSGGDLHAR